LLKNKLKKPTCPECKGTDIDCWPEDAKFGCCYICKQSVEVVYATSEELIASLHKSRMEHQKLVEAKESVSGRES
jgi:hypothetical protein